MAEAHSATPLPDLQQSDHLPLLLHLKYAPLFEVVCSSNCKRVLHVQAFSGNSWSVARGSRLSSTALVWNTEWSMFATQATLDFHMDIDCGQNGGGIAASGGALQQQLQCTWQGIQAMVVYKPIHTTPSTRDTLFPDDLNNF